MYIVSQRFVEPPTLALRREDNGALQMASRLQERSHLARQLACARQETHDPRHIYRQLDWNRGLPRQHHRLAVVIGDQLGELVEPICGEVLQPNRDLGMQADTLAASQRSIGDVAEEDVAEGVQAVLSRRDQVLCKQVA